MSERKLREMSLGSTGMTKSATPFLLWKPCWSGRDPSQDPEEEWKARASIFFRRHSTDMSEKLIGSGIFSGIPEK